MFKRSLVQLSCNNNQNLKMNISRGCNYDAIGEGNDKISVEVGSAEAIKVLENKSAISLTAKSGFKVEVGDMVVH